MSCKKDCGCKSDFKPAAEPQPKEKIRWDPPKIDKTAEKPATEKPADKGCGCNCGPGCKP